MRIPRLVVWSTFFILLGAAVVQAKDHPLLKPYPGSTGGIVEQREFDEYELITGPVQDQKLTKSLHLEGKITVLKYTSPPERSVVEIYRNYEAALMQAGFETLFACKAAECGSGWVMVKDLEQISAGYDNTRVFSARLSRPQGDVYVALHMPANGGKTILNLIETKPMESGMVAVNAAALAGDIGRSGHVAVYGIFFDTGKAEVKPESEPTLSEIAKLLKQNASLKLHVVGHTDSTGNLAMNMDLSRRRAAAVVQALTTRYGIAAARLNAGGVGPLAPVSSNDAEAGRARNRRVELVKQ